MYTGHIRPSFTIDVWLPVLNPATKTLLPSGLTANARGVSVKKVIILSGVLPSVVPRWAGSNTQTSARGTLAVVIYGSPAVSLGVLTANSCVPPGDMAIGRTWPLSNSMKLGGAARADPASSGALSSAT